jgi:hypothetical protein
MEPIICLERSAKSGEKNKPPQLWIEEELVEKGAGWPLGDNKLMFSPCGPTSTEPPLNTNQSLSAENWHGRAT